VRLSGLFGAAGLALRPGARRRELERLFALTAAAFGTTLPDGRSRGARRLLRDYAAFTRERAEEALGRAERLDTERVQALQGRLFQAGRHLGARYRSLLRVSSLSGAMAAARLIYRGLGIDFRGSADGEVTVRRCSFASVYSPRVCALVSGLDSGLLSGLAGGGELRFCQRITEGVPSCRAVFKGEAHE
jgi:hypothetical protein